MKSEAVQPRPWWRALVWPALAGIVAFTVLVSLGNWQMRRLAWKEELIATSQQRLSMAPMTIEELVTRRETNVDIDFLPVSGRGVFQHDKEQHYYVTRDGAPGWSVFTPWVTDEGYVIFVNRGFVPIVLKESETRPEGLTAGETVVHGMARSAPKEKPNFFTPENKPLENEYYWRDLHEMARRAGLENNDRLLPFFIYADETPVAGGWPLGGALSTTFPNKHFGYAMTWYGLAVCLVGVFFAYAWGRWRGRF